MIACWLDVPPYLIKLMIEQGVDVTKIDELGFSALLYASRCPKPTVIKALLEAGADPNDRPVRLSIALIS